METKTNPMAGSQEGVARGTPAAVALPALGARDAGAQVQVAVGISGLTKTYGAIRAVQDLSLEIRKGEIFALLGPNGAGKTTTIEILCGIVTPTEGVVVVDGHDIVRDYRA